MDKPPSGRGGPETVPVVITSEDGRTLSLDVPLGAPLRRIGPAMENHFKLAASSQVLKYNGDPLVMDESLQSAGALLLPGEPYVKLSLMTAKGNLVAMVGVLPTGKEVPISVHETTSFKEIKKILCRGSKNLEAKQVRLYYRYNELADGATPQYYRIPNNARIECVRKPDFDFDSKKEKTRFSPATRRREDAEREKKQQVQKRQQMSSIPSKRPNSSGDTAASMGTVRVRGGTQQPATADGARAVKRNLDKENARESPSIQYKERERNTASARGAREPPAARSRPASASNPAPNPGPVASAGGYRSRPTSGGAGYGTGGSGRLRDVNSAASNVVGNAKYSPTTKKGTPAHTRDNRPKAYYEVEKEVDSDGEELDPDEGEHRKRLQILQQTLQSLQGNLDRTEYRGSPRKTAPRGRVDDDPVMDGTLLSLQDQVKEANKRHQEALERIAELERCVERYQSLLRKAVNSGFSMPPQMMDWVAMSGGGGGEADVLPVRGGTASSTRTASRRK